MKLINSMNKISQSVLSVQEYIAELDYVKSPYLKEVFVDEGMLIYNSLTSEIILLDNNESLNNKDNFKWMVEHWFYFPLDINPKAIAYMTKKSIQYQTLKNRKSKKSYTILTTTDCNARCFYCYEAGVRKRTMDKKTALDVAKYIVRESKNEKVHFSWFGGEPLCNPSAIREICNHAKKCGLQYSSSMITNGYLLNEFEIEEMKCDWHLTNVQITLDGTKEVYLTSKNYKNEDKDAFSRVLENIEKLLSNDIMVSIRLNISISNGNDVVELIKQLDERFGQFKNFKAYANELFIGEGNPPLKLTPDETVRLFENVIKVYQALESSSIDCRISSPIWLKSNHCMADSGECMVITPEGNLAPCEHYVDCEICGNIYEGILDKKLLASWKEPTWVKPECDTCYNYPKCVKIKKCPTDCRCDDAQRLLMDYKIETEIKNIYSDWRERND